MGALTARATSNRLAGGVEEGKDAVLVGERVLVTELEEPARVSGVEGEIAQEIPALVVRRADPAQEMAQRSREALELLRRERAQVLRRTDRHDRDRPEVVGVRLALLRA